ncbi:RNA-directed DNA polymerase from mobile element jockey [Trichonephila clavipes]|nr:RNA-directed DNA polymerase from mobile element jockey [Trichonephila clavipes]
MQRPVCYRDLKTSTQDYIHRVWQETGDQQILNKLHSIHPSTSHWAALPVRRHDVRLTQLRIGQNFVSRTGTFCWLGQSWPCAIKINNHHHHHPNPLRCFQVPEVRHSQTACRGQLTCSRCASVGHASPDCSLEPQCINCSQPHTADSKLLPQWKTEKQIQEIKTNKNITYVEARKLIVPRLVQNLCRGCKASIVNNSPKQMKTSQK